MSKSLKYTLFWVTVYSLGMAFLESAVVVYLRELYYPGKDLFPLQLVDSHIAITELLRELATVIMLVSIGFMVSKNAKARFAWFIYSFAIWDIFYYVFLKLLINWPMSILEWDVLFLLPFTWVGPVIAPVINSICMIVLALIIVTLVDKNKSMQIGKWPWLLLIVGSLVVIVAYTQDYVRFMSQQFSIFELLKPSNGKAIIKLAQAYIPLSFNWLIFGTGVGMHLTAIAMVLKRNK